jgi:hypothetical protein
MVAALRLGAVLLAVSLTGCGGGDDPPQLVDGSPAAGLPAAIENLDEGVMTSTRVIPPGELNKGRFTACGQPPVPSNAVFVERVGVRGSSWTFVGRGRSLHACDAVPEPSTAKEPDRPYDGIWCGAASGRLDAGVLNDPRLDLCEDTDGELTAFAWVEPEPETRWVVVADAGQREVYEVAESLPVRVTTTDGVQAESSRASFDVEEYAADGTKLREYVLETAVAG